MMTCDLCSATAVWECKPSANLPWIPLCNDHYTEFNEVMERRRRLSVSADGEITRHRAGASAHSYFPQWHDESDVKIIQSMIEGSLICVKRRYGFVEEIPVGKVKWFLSKTVSGEDDDLMVEFVQSDSNGLRSIYVADIKEVKSK